MYATTIRRANLAVWTRVTGIALFAVATGVSARISVILPFSPVPLTLQVLVVILSGLVLGAKDGLIAQGLYLQAILLGAPVTAMGVAGPAALVSPTAGYLWAFPLAAGLAGWLGHRPTTLKGLRRIAGGLAALALIYVLGVAWLSVYVDGLGNAWRLGVVPFVGADALKVVIAAAVLSARD